jgi:hypothetical protein
MTAFFHQSFDLLGRGSIVDENYGLFKSDSFLTEANIVWD